jgi:nitroreductase
VEFAEVIRSRRMVRSFTTAPVSPGLLRELLDLARRAPSAGNTGGTEFLVLTGDETARFWDCTLPAARREGFQWPLLLAAPVLVLPLAIRQAYLDRYSEPDKAASPFGGEPSSWPVPYWEIDCAFATMNLLLAAHDRGLGALFFAIASGRDQLLAELEVPDGITPIGAVALGWPAEDRPSSSATRARRPATEVLHWGRYGQHR